YSSEHWRKSTYHQLTMNTANSLPLIDLSPTDDRQLQVHPAIGAEPRALPRVIRKTRQGPVLHASALGEPGQVLSLNLTMGCVQRCGFCSARAHPIHPGDDTVFLFADTAERLERELANLRRRPRAVFISPATDPFPPSLEIQAENVRVVEVLA